MERQQKKFSWFLLAMFWQILCLPEGVRVKSLALVWFKKGNELLNAITTISLRLISRKWVLIRLKRIRCVLGLSHVQMSSVTLHFIKHTTLYVTLHLIGLKSFENIWTWCGSGRQRFNCNNWGFYFQSSKPTMFGVTERNHWAALFPVVAGKQTKFHLILLFCSRDSLSMHTNTTKFPATEQLLAVNKNVLHACEWSQHGTFCYC